MKFNFGALFGDGNGTQDLELEFVFLKKLPGIRRWRLVWRSTPTTPLAKGESIFFSDSSQAAYERAMAKNAELRRKFAREKADRERAERDKVREKHRQRREAHEDQVGGEHRTGNWWNCPVCNPNKAAQDKERRRKPKDE